MDDCSKTAKFAGFGESFVNECCAQPRKLMRLTAMANILAAISIYVSFSRP